MTLAGGSGWRSTPLPHQRHGCRVSLPHANRKVCIGAPFSSFRVFAGWL